MLQKVKHTITKLNIYSALFVISPIFVVAVVLEAYLVAICFFAGFSIFITLFVRKHIHYIPIPIILLAAFYFTLYIFLPALSHIYFYILPYFGFVGTILIIGSGAVAFFILISYIPDLKITKKYSIQPSVLIPLWLAAIALIFILLPIITMICSESIQALIDAFNDPIVKYAIWLSIETAFYATCIALVLGIPLAYLLARKDFFGKAFIKSIVDLPVVIPHTVAGIALLTVFGAHGIIGAPLENASIKFVDAMPGIVVAMLFVSIPFVINSAQDGFEAVDRRLENVARNLGASRLKTFTTITLPLASRNIFTGSIMAWARAVSEFGAVIILVYYLKVAPTLIYDKFIEGGLYASRPVAILLILVCLTVFIVLRFVTTYKIPLKKRSYKRFGR